MRLVKYLIAFSALLAIASCDHSDPQIITRPVIQERDIAIAQRPRPVSLREVEFFVVTEENYDEFAARFVEQNGQLTFVAISIDDYEDMALNLADLRRFIEQQREVIVYYENAVAN